MSKDLSIMFCERGVIRGHVLDNCVLGKPLSHPFLVLKKGDEVVSELHGTWSARSEVKDNQPAISKKLELSLAIASITGQTPRLSSAFESVFPNLMPVNRMIALQGDRQYRLAERKSLLIDDDEQAAVTWESMLAVSSKVDSMKLPYVRYAFTPEAVNCQKTMKVVMQSGGIKVDDLLLELGEAGWDRPWEGYSAAI